MYTETQARAANRAKADKQLAAPGIIDGATGTYAFSRKITDLTEPFLPGKLPDCGCIYLRKASGGVSEYVQPRL